MPKGTTFKNDVVALTFNATPIANIADNAASSPLTSLYLSLHTADPAGSYTNETSYTNYVRIAVARTSGGWTVASGQASNAALAQFAQCGASGATITYVGIGTASTAGKLLYSGALSSSLAVANGIQPQFAIGALTVTES